MEKDKINRLVIWLFPILLIVPNLWLNFTSDMPVSCEVANVAIPLGLYLLAMTITRRTGWIVLAFLPLMVLNAFQIVLFFLYGNGIIAIDMFLNVATTSVGEAMELLDSLLPAIAVVLIIYLPPIIWAIVSLCRKERSQMCFTRPRVAGGAVLVVGILFAVLGFSKYLPRQLYPLNICGNLVEAVSRFHRTEGYASTSRPFSYHAKSTHDKGEKEIYVLVVGETSRADNWQIMGYDRETNPYLSLRHDLMAYPRCLSESNTTHKSVPMILSPLNSHTFGDSIYMVKSIFEAFKEAGFRTVFISDQKPNHSFIDFFGEQADDSRFIVNHGEEQLDGNIIKYYRECLDTIHGNCDKLFMVIHSYGSHFNYRHRYPESLEHFQPADYVNATPESREQLLNAYDNTIRYTDTFLAVIIEELERTGYNTAMVYLSDHGEDIFDDERGRFLHASPTPTYYQLHVPMLVWASEPYAAVHADKLQEARNHTANRVSSSRAAFHTILDLAGIDTPYFDPAESLASPYFKETPWVYINDYNESVALDESGLTVADLTKIYAL